MVGLDERDLGWTWAYETVCVRGLPIRGSDSSAPSVEQENTPSRHYGAYRYDLDSVPEREYVGFVPGVERPVQHIADVEPIVCYRESNESSEPSVNRSTCFHLLVVRSSIRIGAGVAG